MNGKKSEWKMHTQTDLSIQKEAQVFARSLLGMETTRQHKWTRSREVGRFPSYCFERSSNRCRCGTECERQGNFICHKSYIDIK